MSSALYYRRHSPACRGALVQPAPLELLSSFHAQSLLLYHRLTTPGFRQRADRERTFTASAPPGMRPPPRRSEPDATDNFVGRDLDRDLVVDAEMEIGIRAQPRQGAVSMPRAHVATAQHRC